jgi:hypothetical protein
LHLLVSPYALQDPHLKSQALVRSALAEDSCTGEIALHYKVKSNPAGCYLPAYDFYALGQLLAFILARGNETLHQKVVCMAAAAYHAGNQPEHYYGVRALLGSHPGATKGLLDVLVALLGPMESRPCSYRALQQLLARARMDCRSEPDAKQNWSSISSLLSSGSFCHYDDEVLIGQVEEDEDETDCMAAAAGADTAAVPQTCPAAAAAAVHKLQQQVQQLQQRKPLASLRQRIKKTVWCGFKRILKKCTVMLLPCVRVDASRYSEDDSSDQQQQQQEKAASSAAVQQQQCSAEAAMPKKASVKAAQASAARSNKLPPLLSDSSKTEDAAAAVAGQPLPAAGKAEAAAAASGSSQPKERSASNKQPAASPAAAAAAAAAASTSAAAAACAGSPPKQAAPCQLGSSSCTADDDRCIKRSAARTASYCAKSIKRSRRSSKDSKSIKSSSSSSKSSTVQQEVQQKGSSKDSSSTKSSSSKDSRSKDSKSTKSSSKSSSAARPAVEQLKGSKSTKSSSSSSKGSPAQPEAKQQKGKAPPLADIKQLADELGVSASGFAQDAKLKRSKKRQGRAELQQQQQQQVGSTNSSSSSRHEGSGLLKVDSPLSLFELMVLLPGQQIDEVAEVQEMLGWLLFSDDH